MTDASHCVDRLTKKQKDILVFIANEYSQKEISETMSLSVNAVSCQVKQMYKKLEVSGAVGATKIAIKAGLIGI